VGGDVTRQEPEAGGASKVSPESTVAEAGHRLLESASPEWTMRRVVVATLLMCASPGCGLGGNGGGGSGGESSGCSSNRECGDLEFCNAGSCDEVAGRKFFVSAESGTAVTDGDWDAGGGAPDPYVVIFMNGRQECYTSTDDDTFNPRWGEGCDVVFDSGGELEIDMYDEDVTSDDLMLTFVASGTDELVSLVRDESVTLSNDYASLDISVTPDF
jgi:hypothetical protein